MPLTVLHPVLFSFGLLCVSIPIILHLLRRRRRIIPWGAMRFLEEAYRKRRRLITIEQIILLALRCLLLLLIALGVGALVLGSKSREDLPTTLAIVLDNSIGSGITVEGRTDLLRNKGRALEAVESLDPTRGDRVALITAARPSRARVLPASNDLTAVRSQIEQIEQSDARLDIDGAIRLAAAIDDEDPGRPTKRALLIAGQGRGLESIEQSRDQAVPAVFDEFDVIEPATDSVENIGILDAVPSRSLLLAQGAPLPMTLRVRLIRSGALDLEHEQTLRVVNAAGEEVAHQAVLWEHGERERSATLAIDTTLLDQRAGGLTVLKVEIDPDSNISDNGLLVTVPLREGVRVAVIDTPSPGRVDQGQSTISPSRWVRAALAPEDGLGVTIVNINANRASAQLIDGLDAVVVLSPSALDESSWDRLDRLRQQGALILLTPDAQGDSVSWIEQVNRIEPGLIGLGARIETHEPALSLEASMTGDNPLSGIGTELPVLARSVEIHRSLNLGTDSPTLLARSDGAPLGVWSLDLERRRGMLVVLGVALDLRWTDLPARPVFVAIMQELIRQGIGLGVTPEPRIAGDELDESVWGGSSKRISFNPQQPGAPVGEGLDRLTDHAGLVGHDDRDGALRSMTPIWPDAIGANAAISPRDAYTKYLASRIDADQINWIGNTQSTESSAGSQSSGAQRNGRRLGIWMLSLALCVALVELVLARLFTARLIRNDLAVAPIGGRA